MTRLHKEELSPNAIRLIESRRIRSVRHVACTGDRRGVYSVLVGKPEKRDHLEDLGVNGRMIFKQIFKKWDKRHGLD
jgi:hypothetical protein